jgi:hypothetical protein
VALGKVQQDLLEGCPESSTHKHSSMADCQIELMSSGLCLWPVFGLIHLKPAHSSRRISEPGIYALSIENSGPSNSSKLPRRPSTPFPSIANAATHPHPYQHATTLSSSSVSVGCYVRTSSSCSSSRGVVDERSTSDRSSSRSCTCLPGP